MKFAIPTLNNEITAHFGHCDKFAIIETTDNVIIKEEIHTPPVHQPGSYPKFLAKKGVNVIIAGGMGQKAQDLFAQNNIKVHLGVITGTAKKLVEDHINNQLKTGGNLCDH
ncbi:MAG: ATPase [Draconibacterium sp.]|nr:ATPase [Draconibacterium sp.]